MKTIAGLLVFVILLFGACSAPAGIPTETPEPSPVPEATTGLPPEAGAEENGGASPPATVVPEPEPVKEDTAICKGFFMAGLPFTDDAQSMGQVERLKEANANLVSIAPTVMIDPNGNVEYKRAHFHPTDEDFEERLRYLIQRYHDAGIMVSMVIEVDYVQQLNQNPSAPGSIPASKAGQAGFLDRYNLMVVTLAQLAQNNGVEYFAPMNEPDRKLGAQVASEWGQQILPLIKDVYNGKVTFKGDFETLCGDGIDFTGYEVLGFSSSPQTTNTDTYRSQVKERINKVLEWAERDGVPQVMATELGAWAFQTSFSEQDITNAHEIVFAEGNGKIQGFIVLDPMQGMPGTEQALYGSNTFETVKNWFSILE